MTISRNRVGHVEIVHVLDQVGAVHLGVAGLSVGELLESRGLDMVELDDMWGEGGDSGSQLLDVVVWKWGSDLLGHSSKNHPVILSETWGREAASGSLWSSIDVDVGSDLLEVAGGGEDEVGVEGSLITSMSLIDNEGILWDLLMSELVITEKEDNLGGLQV